MPESPLKIGRLLLLFVSLAVVPSIAMAQPKDVPETDVVRFTQRIPDVGDDSAGVAVYLHRSPEKTGWNVRLVDRSSGETINHVTLPEWAGADYYGYDALQRNLDGVPVVLFEAAPAPGLEAPPGAERFQIAWAFGESSSADAARWRQIAQTRTSILDGGERLVFRPVDGKERLVMMRTSEATRFCGSDLTAYQVFVPEKSSFRSEIDLDSLLEETKTADVSLPSEPFVRPPFRRYSLWFSASSDRRNSDDSRTVIRPLELGDDDLRTAWMEGVAGTGRGEFVTARISEALKLRGFRIFPGHGLSEEENALFPRPKKLLVSLSDGTRYVIELPDTPYRTLAGRGGLFVEFPQAVRTNCLSVVLLESRPADRRATGDESWKRSHSAISEITPVSELFGLEPEVAALVVVEKLLKLEDPRRSRRLVTLVDPLGGELVKILETVLEDGTEEDRVRVIPLLRGLPSERSVPILIGMFSRLDSRDRAYALVKRAIVSHGRRAGDALVKIYREETPTNRRKYTDLVRLIGRLGTPDDLKPLLESFGHHDAHVRNERVRAVARGGEAMLPALFQKARVEIDTEAGRDTLKAISSIGRLLYARGQGKAEGSEALLVALARSKKRRQRMLALRGLGYFRTEGAVPALEKRTRSDRDPLVRKSAVAAIARYPGREARRAVERALNDGSPDVRIEAVDALARRDDRRQAIPAVLIYVERERWKPGLETAYTLLADMADRRILNRLEREVAKNPQGQKALIITAALERAEKTLSAATILRLLEEPDVSYLMRRRLVDLLGLDDSEEGFEYLVTLAESSDPYPALTDRRSHTIRQRAILALGRRRSPQARETLMHLVRESSSTDVKKSALRGLAFLNDESIVPELRMMRNSAAAALREDFDDTIDMIERRADFKEVEEEVEEAIEERDGIESDDDE